MTEWRRYALMREERDAAMRRVRELEDELAYQRDEYDALETINQDLTVELAEARLRHPSSRER